MTERGGEPAGVAGLVARLAARGETVATAESITGGLITATLTSVPGASAVVRGGLVVYATDLKARLAGVDPGVLADGAVQPGVAAALAHGARQRCAATWGIGITGVAGPDPQEGHAPGTVYCAVAGPDGALVTAALDELTDAGRAEVRAAAVELALRLTTVALDAADRDAGTGR